jgi:uncharacterized protein
MPPISFMLWRRLDVPGHDACRLEPRADGWRLEGTAVFRHENGPANIAYAIRCDGHWHSVSGRIAGFIGERVIDYIVAREDRVWRLNGTALSGLGHLSDLDLGFTPATNIQQLRRVAIAENETVQLPVAWLDVDAGTLTELPQVYERRGPATFWYQAPSFGYEGLLELASNGFIRSYPNLWEGERSL